MHHQQMQFKWDAHDWLRELPLLSISKLGLRTGDQNETALRLVQFSHRWAGSQVSVFQKFSFSPESQFSVFQKFTFLPEAIFASSLLREPLLLGVLGCLGYVLSVT